MYYLKQLGTLMIFTGCLICHYLARDSKYLSDAAELEKLEKLPQRVN